MKPYNGIKLSLLTPLQKQFWSLERSPKKTEILLSHSHFISEKATYLHDSLYLLVLF